MKKTLLLIALVAVAACRQEEKASDAYGNFEVEETVISSEVPGKILSFNIEEGQRLEKGQKVAQIDTMSLSLKKQQLQWQYRSLSNEFSTLDAQVSPIKPMQIIMGKVLPYVLLSFINAGVILSLSYFVFGMPFNGSIILLLAEALLFILMALALGILISTISNSQQTAMMLSMFGLLLPTILLSGFIFPIKNMPYILQLLAQLMPSKWFIVIVKSIMLKGGGLADVWVETVVLLGMTLLFIVGSIRKFNVRLS